ncbi:hypothetical protein [Ruminococcus albus]|uniref:hypothetical protein n=1 Tax=Ruminococcus albus TaxID=1264 RepID=UPI000462FF77|nr:hypothetical protein [Ruminococcus albus]
MTGLQSSPQATINPTDFVKVPYHGHWQKQLKPFCRRDQGRYRSDNEFEDEPEDKETVRSVQKMRVLRSFWTKTDSVIVKCDGKNIAGEYNS